MRHDKPNEWISIADLMAGVVGVVIIFFLVMAVLAHKEASASASEAEGLKNERAAMVGFVKSKMHMNANILQIFKDRQDVVPIPDEMFKTGETDLTPAGKKITEDILKNLAEILPCYANSGITCTGDPRSKCSSGKDCVRASAIYASVLIEGHADSKINNKLCDNWCLSTARAKAVFELARKEQPSLLTLNNADDQPLLGLAGYGDTRPLPFASPTDAIQRRVEIRFILSAGPASDPSH